MPEERRRTKRRADFPLADVNSKWAKRQAAVAQDGRFQIVWIYDNSKEV